MPLMPPIHLAKWIEENRDLLKPPVGNKMIWQDAEFLVMAVGGPNARKDFHVEEGEEFFYQVEGDIVLQIVENGEIRDIPIREGEMFLLPARVPHSPQRPPNTVGLVIERKRRAGENDHLRWLCENCGELLFDASFEMTSLGNQLEPVMRDFWSDEAKRTCQACGVVMQPPEPVAPRS